MVILVLMHQIFCISVDCFIKEFKRAIFIYGYINPAKSFKNDYAIIVKYSYYFLYHLSITSVDSALIILL